MDTEMKRIDSTIHFLSRDPLYEAEKPYSLRFTSDRIPHTNLKPEKHAVRITDLRGIGDQTLDLDSCGFGILHMNSSLTYPGFFDREKVKMIYYKEIGKLLKSAFKANFVFVLDHVVCLS